MKKLIFLLLLTNSIWNNAVFGQKITINWVENLSGDYTFSKHWSYPMNVEVKDDGRAGCADGGFCPERCYNMLDSNGIVLKDSAYIFYQLLDTMPQFYSIQCDARCFEWAGTNFIHTIRKGKDHVFCQTALTLATHCRLTIDIEKSFCNPSIILNSITSSDQKIFICINGSISIDKKLWEMEILKAEFSFYFENKEDPNKPFFWKGKIYSKIQSI